jgi:hypothetical protein
VASCCECGDEPSGSCATELVSLVLIWVLKREDKWSAKASAINCDSVIILVPTSSWIHSY